MLDPEIQSKQKIKNSDRPTGIKLLVIFYILNILYWMSGGIVFLNLLNIMLLLLPFGAIYSITVRRKKYWIAIIYDLFAALYGIFILTQSMLPNFVAETIAGFFSSVDLIKVLFFVVFVLIHIVAVWYLLNKRAYFTKTVELDKPL